MKIYTILLLFLLYARVEFGWQINTALKGGLKSRYFLEGPPSDPLTTFSNPRFQWLSPFKFLTCEPSSPLVSPPYDAIHYLIKRGIVGEGVPVVALIVFQLGSWYSIEYNFIYKNIMYLKRVTRKIIQYLYEYITKI